MDEAEDVVDEQKHVLAHDVAEVLGHGQRRQPHAETGAGRFVHLPEHHGGLVDDPRLAHLQVQVVTLPGALAHAAEDRDAAVVGGDAVDELEDDHRLAHARAAEQTDLATLDVRREQVDDLDPGLEDLGGGFQFFELGSGTVDGPALHVGWNGVALVDRIAEQVEQTAQRGLPHGHGDELTGVGHFHASGQTVGRVHAHGADLVVTQMLLDLGDQVDMARRRVDVEHESVVDGRQLIRELNVDHRSDDLNDLAFVHRFLVSSFRIRTVRRRRPPLPGSPG